VIAFMTVVYTAVVVALFKLKLVKPRPVPIAVMVLVGVFLIGGILVAWLLCAPVSQRVVTSTWCRSCPT
jgi:hypothetical protein